MTIKTFDSESFCGYTQITTFFEDFSIADNFGVAAIRDTYNNAFNSWKDNYKYVTELCMVLNWKSWEHAHNTKYCELYVKLFYKIKDWCCRNLKGDELSYFFRTID